MTEPLVLILEDLHWAIPPRSIGVRARALPDVGKDPLIATYRSTDVTRSAQPLHALKRDLVARHLCRELVLQHSRNPRSRRTLRRA